MVIFETPYIYASILGILIVFFALLFVVRLIVGNIVRHGVRKPPSRR